MQMFGIGILELLVILVLTTVVVGPDRLPAVAADLARWIRQGRAYARHLMGDFNSVISELEKEANVSREDWKEIASVVNRHSGDLGKELTRVSRDIEQAGDLEAAKSGPPSNVVPIDGAHNGDAPVPESNGASEGNGSEAKPGEEKPWYVPEQPRRTRRRSRE